RVWRINPTTAAATLQISPTLGRALGGFTIGIQAPAITAITPASADVNTSVSVTITGSNFLDGMTVKLMKSGAADIVATNVQMTSATQLTAMFDFAGSADCESGR